MSPVSKRRFKLMWDYSAFPLWAVEEDGSQFSTGNVKISDGLRRDLQQRSDDWTAVKWGTDGPETAEPPSTEVFEEWDTRGRALLRRLRNELGSQAEIGYFNEATGEVEWRDA
jgi:hypothetical protein